MVISTTIAPGSKYTSDTHGTLGYVDPGSKLQSCQEYMDSAWSQGSREFGVH